MLDIPASLVSGQRHDRHRSAVRPLPRRYEILPTADRGPESVGPAVCVIRGPTLPAWLLAGGV